MLPIPSEELETILNENIKQETEKALLNSWYDYYLTLEFYNNPNLNKYSRDDPDLEPRVYQDIIEFLLAERDIYDENLKSFVFLDTNSLSDQGLKFYIGTLLNNREIMLPHLIANAFHSYKNLFTQMLGSEGRLIEELNNVFSYEESYRFILNGYINHYFNRKEFRHINKEATKSFINSYEQKKIEKKNNICNRYIKHYVNILRNFEKVGKSSEEAVPELYKTMLDQISFDNAKYFTDRIFIDSNEYYKDSIRKGYFEKALLNNLEKRNAYTFIKYCSEFFEEKKEIFGSDEFDENQQNEQKRRIMENRKYVNTEIFHDNYY